MKKLFRLWHKTAEVVIWMEKNHVFTLIAMIIFFIIVWRYINRNK